MGKDFIYGVDLGWVSQLESQGIYWINKNGNRIDPIEALKEMGATAVRLRVFVNPPREAYWHKYEKKAQGRMFGGEDCMLGFCDKASVLEMAKRVKKLDLGLMIDFHYSDHFADPIYQDIPQEWEKEDFEGLQRKVEEHTREVLTLLTANDIYPDWVQVGNEINTGILLPVGSSADEPKQLVAMLNTGYDAVKSCCPDCKVVTHIAGGNDYEMCTVFFDIFFENGGKTDIMGFSYYPYWAQIVHDEAKLQKDMSALAAKYGKPLMLSEIGGVESEEEESYELLAGAVRAIKAVPDGQGLGVFYWEPEVGADFLPDHYILGASRIAGDKCLQFTRVMSAYGDNK
ncbi:MAG: glycosyl hydrolase 53 family protein [Lachnospiraceae bacterium]|nr:glycosyl hydrolase 53 family protein [Lachnospiraceae bacterium]